MDRFNLPSPETICGRCAYCDKEIYPGDSVYDVDGDKVHDDCLMIYLRESGAIKFEIAGDER